MHTHTRAHMLTVQYTALESHMKKLVCQNSHTHLHAHAYAISKTSPSQPEDKGAVVARQQVSLAPTHLEAASAPTISQWLPTSS